MFFLCRLMERKSFFYANYFNWSLTSPVILDTRACCCRTKLIPQWSTSKVAHCFSPDFESECLQRRKKSLSVFVLDSKTKEDDKMVLQRVGFEIRRERQGLLLQTRKMNKRWQSFWETHWNYREIEFHEFLSERSELFRPRSGQASDKFATGPAPYKNRTKDFLKVYYSGRAASRKTPGSGLLSIFPRKCRTFREYIG